MKNTFSELSNLTEEETEMPVITWNLEEVLGLEPSALTPYPVLFLLPWDLLLSYPQQNNNLCEMLQGSGFKIPNTFYFCDMFDERKLTNPYHIFSLVL